MHMDFLKLIQFLTFLAATSYASHTPVVLWHGLGELCCNDHNLVGYIKKQLMDYLPGIHVVTLRIGNSDFEDYVNGFTMHPFEQIEIACKSIKSDPLLANGYNGIGYSQGSVLLRGLAQRCPQPKMKNLITTAGLHQGVYGLPACANISNIICKILRHSGFVNELVYLSLIQNWITPSTYWHNSLDRAAYVAGSTFLANINNEKVINETYIKNLQLLENFVMVKHELDEIVQPVESSWFGFFKDGQDLQDRLGLKKMDKDGKLQFLSTPWTHAQFEWAWFQDNIVDVY